MDTESRTTVHDTGVINIEAPARQTAPIVFSSPHSGRDYPAEFVAASCLDPVKLRRSEDSFVDELFRAAPGHGAPLLKALFPRAYVDPNREAFELDPAMFADHLPSYVNTASPRVAAGLGTIARVVTNGEEIYDAKLHFAEAAERIDKLYKPYHLALSALIAETKSQFGHCIVIDCHSMPSVGGPMDRDAGRRRVDIVLGDAHERACAPRLPAFVADQLGAMGYIVTRNTPYSGGYITRHYGRPGDGVHALQMEINRALYMDEGRVERAAGMAGLQADIERLVASLCAWDLMPAKSARTQR